MPHRKDAEFAKVSKQNVFFAFLATLRDINLVIIQPQMVTNRHELIFDNVAAYLTGIKRCILDLSHYLTHIRENLCKFMAG